MQSNQSNPPLQQFCSCQHNSFEAFYEWFYTDKADMSTIESTGQDIIEVAHTWAMANGHVVLEDGIYNTGAKCTGCIDCID
jgi:hypothetical protein